jgi:CRP-like cAMP-binding protein/rhodanese-related sulfurtransferase
MQQNTINLGEFSTLVPIKALNPDRARELSEKSELCHASKGQVVFSQGDEVKHIIYLMSGEVAMFKDDVATKRVKGGSRMAKLPLEQGKQYQHTARALTDVSYIKVDPETLDTMLEWDKSGGYEVQDIKEDSDDGDWMAKLLQAKVFHRIPPANIQSIFMRLETEHFKKGEAVINQGEEGENFYIIRQGACRVVRKTRKNPEGMVLATLKSGDNFGEESLISGGKRNASVIMETDGVLMKLPKTDFLDLLNEPLLKWITYEDAKTLAPDGGVWIDVRLPAEFKTSHIKGGVNIPLPLLRMRFSLFDNDHRYLVYCDSGRRSSIAAYLLSQNGFDAFVLQGSLDVVPKDDME